ncbi:sulfurtransferase complex subunit TusC [Paraglaciecola chathamensis]|uniref:Protein tusC homolog n=2 Tax=Paraglaciecola chathamensis TaxID=368405 RepID=A0ABQ0IC88_9ALTE|nr:MULTISPECIES: sulfurtransferase complex subunit TusC [Paraglaciecola]GAC07013.1 protein tusC homolog [Paraglaciecola agarilytica NO2]GAC09439.1 protein tusC homolog [Paraglaciecola chathamensis S18K6]
MITKSLGVINSTAPYGVSNGQESLDLALAAANFGQDVTLFFVDDGVFQLLKSQQPIPEQGKHYSKTFAALTFYDIDDIFVCQHSLTKRGIAVSDLCIQVTALPHEELNQQLAQLDHLMRF